MIAKPPRELAGLYKVRGRAKEAQAAGSSDLEIYKHAFETTAADRDRLAQELETYKQAFETTVADRDRLAARLAELTDPLDAGYFRTDVAELDPSLLEAAFRAGDYETIVKNALATARPTFNHEADYLRPFATYYIACAHIARRDFDRARPYVAALEFSAPPDVPNLLPYDLRQASRLSFYKQEQALESGRPGAILVSLPKSASAFLSHNIARAFDIPILRTSLGDGFRALVVPRWAKQVARGGAITHEHFQPLPENLAAIPGEIWVQVRDPRDAVFSVHRMAENMPASGIDRSQEVENFCTVVGYYAQWIDDWLRVDRARIVTFDEVTTDLSGTIERIFGEAPKLDAVTANARKGSGGEWRAYGTDVCKKAWSVIPDAVKARLLLSQ